MDQKLPKTCSYAVLVLALTIGVVAVATSNSFALAQPCSVQIGSPNVSPQQYYYGANFQVTLPVSATCSFYPGQLYATGTAYDTTYNANIGTANTALSATYGGYGFSGELTFTLPTSAQYHSVQFSVSIYSAQNGYYGGYYGGALLATASSTFALAPSYYQSYPTYPTYPSYLAPSYPTSPPNHYPNTPRYNQNHGGNYYMSGYYNYYQNDGNYNNNNYCGLSNHCNHR